MPPPQNFIQMQGMVSQLSDPQIRQMLLTRSPEVPSFMLLGEMQKRQQMRGAAAGQQPKSSGSILQQVLGMSGMGQAPGQGIGGAAQGTLPQALQAGAQPPQGMSGPPLPQQAPVPPPQGMASGGRVLGFAQGGGSGMSGGPADYFSGMYATTPGQPYLDTGDLVGGIQTPYDPRAIARAMARSTPFMGNVPAVNMPLPDLTGDTLPAMEGATLPPFSVKYPDLTGDTLPAMEGATLPNPFSGARNVVGNSPSFEPSTGAPYSTDNSIPPTSLPVPPRPVGGGGQPPPGMGGEPPAPAGLPAAAGVPPPGGGPPGPGGGGPGGGGGGAGLMALRGGPGGPGGLAKNPAADMTLADYMKQVDAIRGADPYAAVEERMKGRDKESKWLALAQAGFAMAGGTSPWALTNIGKGGEEGIKAYVQAKDKMDAANEKLAIAHASRDEKRVEYGLKMKDQADARFENAQNRLATVMAAKINAGGAAAAAAANRTTQLEIMRERLEADIIDKHGKAALGWDKEAETARKNLLAIGAPAPGTDEYKAAQKSINDYQTYAQQSRDEGRRAMIRRDARQPGGTPYITDPAVIAKLPRGKLFYDKDYRLSEKQ